MITVFNVGQGDSILLQPDFGCCFREFPLLIDCGSRSQQVFSKFDNDVIDVLITHSHKDHLGGFRDLFSRVRNLYIPYYLPEIWNIYDSLKEYLFENVINLDLTNRIFKNVIIVGEGDKICNHLQVLNPPKWPHELFDKSDIIDINIERALEILANSGIELSREKIVNYNTEIESVRNLRFLSSENNDQISRSEYVEFARNYVHNFFISLAISLLRNSSTDVTKLIQRKFHNLIHRASIVFKYDYSTRGNILFTGDADEYVFERLISKGTNISAKYLKVPHHGSKENLTLSIIKKINPEAAIISHNNRRFGRSSDTHPHYEVLDYFDSLGITMYFTNHVIKGGPTLRSAYRGVLDEFIEFKR